jgi:hypothetical protein
MEQRNLAEEWRTIEARYAGPGAQHSGDWIRARLAEARAREADVELRYTIPDPWENTLFIALCRRYGLRPFRRPRMHQATILVRAPEAFFQNTIWPVFGALADALRNHLVRITDGAIREAIYDAETPAPGQAVMPDALPVLGET